MTASNKSFSIGIGVGSKSGNQNWLEVFFPAPVSNVSQSLIDAVFQFSDQEEQTTTVELNAETISKVSAAFDGLEADEQVQTLKNQLDSVKDSKQPAVLVGLEHTSSPQTVPDIYLRLHLLSHRHVQPHGINLDGIFGKLPNIAWTNIGAIQLDELPDVLFQARMKGEWVQVLSVDKFPKMTDYVVPGGVRIADTARVRLGAYVGEGTTVMHEGFINFNAGTVGPNMIEGRISAGVMVESGSDLGGGCSTMGTLSGGNKTVLSVGKDCLIGANAGLGIPLGDKCTIEAGLYVTAASKVSVLDADGKVTATIKAMDLSGKDNLLFRRNSQTGAIECLTNKSAIELNTELHANN